MGRPTKYSPELADSICKLIISGLSLRKIIDQEGMPSRDTIHKWILKNQEFADQYARACHLRREYKFEALEDIAETEQDVQRARLRIDVIKWQLSKEEPKKYGDKLDMTTNGKELPTPILGGIAKSVSANDSNQENSSTQQEN